jgi:phage terminase large subunit-like protein
MPRPTKRNPNLSMADMFLTMAQELKHGAHTPNINAYIPHNKQEKFHRATEAKRLYIGGNRSGKTTGGIVEDIWWLTHRHPYRKIPDRPIAGRIICVDFLNGIEKIIKPQLKQWIPPSELRGGTWTDAYDAGTRTLNFENGSFVELMSYDQDLDKFAGTSRDFVHFDEEPPEVIYEENMARLIDRRGSMWMTLTPIEGMEWIFDQLYEKGRIGTPGISVVEVDMAENPHLSPEAVEEYLAGLNEEERQVRGSGKFITRGGLVYKAFSPEVHLIDPLDPADLRSSNYRHYSSLDHGFNNPTSVHWHAVDRDNQVITFDEHYASGLIIDDHARIIHEKEVVHGRKADIRVCDPALAQRQAVTGTSIQTEYAIRGIGMILGNNDVATGVAKINEYLKTKGPLGKPLWLITRNNVNLIREISKLRWKTWSTHKQASMNNPYEQIHKKDDHACDECRYFFTFMPRLAQPTRPLPVAGQSEFGGTSAVLVTRPTIDPNLTPAALSNGNENRKVDLNEGY